MKIYAKITIKGVKPLLIHSFPIETLSSPKAKGGTTGRDESEWKATVLMTDDRNLYILGSYIVGSIKNGGKQIKVGKGSLMKKVESCLECCDDKILLDGLFVPKEEALTKDTNAPIYLDVRSVVNPSTKGRNLRFRIAAKSGWTLTTMISWEDTALSKEQIRQCVENAGLYEGVGDGRRIGFGRFQLTDFQMVKE